MVQVFTGSSTAQHAYLLPECSKNVFLQLLLLSVIQCTGESRGALCSSWPLLSVPSRPGCPSFPGSPGMQGSVAVLARQVLNFAASVLRYTTVKQVRAKRSLTVRGSIFSGNSICSQMIHRFLLPPGCSLSVHAALQKYLRALFSSNPPLISKASL